MKRGVYYNEIDPFCCAWLRNLIAAGYLPAGDVDERDIRTVQPEELKSYAQVHLFAGIGGWPLALRLAGWPDDLETWTASCPCQPFSGAGKGLGEKDPRHLWPEVRRLAAKRRPAVLVGEQVASPLGRAWLAGIRLDLEELGYAVGAADLCAAGVGAPHIRQRLYWCGLADAERDGWGKKRRNHQENDGHLSSSKGKNSTGVAHPYGNNKHRGSRPLQVGWFWDTAKIEEAGNGTGVKRRVKPGVRLLAHGVPDRVGRLRGYGNAIVPQVGAAFLEAVMEGLP